MRKRRKHKKRMRNYLFLGLALIVIIIIGLLFFTDKKPDQPIFKFVDFIEIYNGSTPQDYVMRYTILNPLKETKDCSITFNTSIGGDTTSRIVELGEFAPEMETSGNFSFIMPTGDSNFDMKLNCK